MRCAILAGLCVVGIVVCLRLHVADGLYREGRAILDDEENGDPRAASTLFERALEVGGDDAKCAIRRGRAGLRIGSREAVEEAAAWFRRAAEMAPVMARAAFWQGVSLEVLGEDEAALDRYEAARRLAPYNVDMNRRIADFYLRRYGRTRSPEDLRRAFETVHALRLVDPDATHEALVRLLSRPLLRYGELDAAVPKTADARVTLAETLAQAGRFRWAVRAFDEADRLAGAGGKLAIRGRMLKYEDDVKDHPTAALEMLEEIRDLAGDAFDLHLELGRTLLRLGRVEEASEPLRRHLSRSDDVEAGIEEIHEAFSGAPEDLRFRAEIAFWESVSKQYTSHEALAMNLHAARASFRMGKPSEALVWLRPYVRWRPPDPQAYFLEARCYQALGQTDVARARLRAALDLRPTDPGMQDLARELGIEGER